MSKSMNLRPRVSEKAYGQSQELRVYVFEVPAGSNRTLVKDAVQTQFSVTVTDVNMLNVKGKEKRTIRRGGRQVMGRRSNFKKAYVTLKEGDSITIFPSEDDEDRTPKNPAAQTKTRTTRVRKESK